MPQILREGRAMLAAMAPRLVPGAWVYCTTADAGLAARAWPMAFAAMREAEGTTLVLPLDAAAALGFDTGLPMRQITLQVHSALEGVGLTAGVAGALAEAGIACNMVAAFHHDHVFVPEAQAGTAMDCLRALQRRAASGG